MTHYYAFLGKRMPPPVTEVFLKVKPCLIKYYCFKEHALLEVLLRIGVTVFFVAYPATSAFGGKHNAFYYFT